MERILIVEDEPLIALDLRYACEDLAIDTVMAATSRSALEALDGARGSPDAIDGAIVDVNLGRGESCGAIVDRLQALEIPFGLNTGDLNRSGEQLDAIDAPIMAKPNVASDVVKRLLELGKR